MFYIFLIPILSMAGSCRNASPKTRDRLLRASILRGVRRQFKIVEQKKVSQRFLNDLHEAISSLSEPHRTNLKKKLLAKVMGSKIKDG